MNVNIRVLSNSDEAAFQDLIRLFEDVFEMKDFVIPPATHLDKILSNPDFISVVAVENDEVIGGLTAYVLHQYYSVRPAAYIFDLAVLTKYQRQGIGQKLIVFFNNYCREKGFEEVFVQGDKVDDYALDFYRKTKPTMEEEAVHFSYVFH